VRNDGDIAALHAAVESLHQRYRALARATAAWTKPRSHGAKCLN